MRALLFILCWVGVLAGPALGQVRLEILDDSGGLVILSIRADTPAPSSWHGVQLVRSALGTCGKPDVLRELAPESLTAAPGIQVEDRLPAARTTYRYALRPVTAAGQPLPDLDQTPTARAHAAKGEAVALRGTLSYLGGRTFALTGCGCWDGCGSVTPQDLDVTLVRMLDWNTRGVALNITAVWNDDPDFPGCFEAVTDVTASPACDALPNTTTTWSALKTSYR